LDKNWTLLTYSNRARSKASNIEAVARVETVAEARIKGGIGKACKSYDLNVVAYSHVSAITIRYLEFVSISVMRKCFHTNLITDTVISY
jgi:hypothetical protein